MKRTHIVISEQLAAQIDTLVGKRGRSNFLAQAAEPLFLQEAAAALQGVRHAGGCRARESAVQRWHPVHHAAQG